MKERFYHGGIAGLSPGDFLVPSPPHVTDGCPICQARAEGRVMRVGEYRAWLLQFNSPIALKALQQLATADDYEPIDPPSGREAVYITTDLDYARWYAARSIGDLYIVRPVGSTESSTEDSFPTWICDRAEILSVMERGVRLSRRDRRSLLRRWKKMDQLAGRKEAA